MRMTPRTGWDHVLSLCLGAAALTAALFGFYLAARHRFVAPYMDMVDLELFLNRRFLSNWTPWAAFSFVDNEHRPVLPIYLFGIEYQFFDGRNAFLQYVNFALIIGMAALLAVAGRLGRDAPRRVAAAVAIAAVLAWPGHWENLVWGKQAHMYLSMALLAGACAAALAIDAAARDDGARRRAAILLSLSLIASGLSFAYGYVGWPLLLGYAAMRRWRRDVWGIMSLGAAAAAALVWIGHTPQPHHTSALAALSRPSALLEYIGAFLGAPIYWVWGEKAIGAANAAGLVALAITVVAALWGLARGGEDWRPAGRLGLLLMGFAVGTAIIVGLGRLDFGPEQAFSSRYLIVPAFWGIGAAMLLSDLLAERIALGRIATAATALLLLGSLWGVGRAVDQMRHFERHARAGAAAAVIGAQPKPGQEQLHPDRERVWALFALDRAAGKGVYAEDWPHWLGRPLAAVLSVDPAATCAGGIVESANVPKGLRIIGEAAPESVGRDGWVALTNAEGVVVGVGAALRTTLADRLRLTRKIGDRAAWVGFVPRDAGPLTAWAVQQPGVACRLAGPA